MTCRTRCDRRVTRQKWHASRDSLEESQRGADSCRTI